jgi:hypothetical protein
MIANISLAYNPEVHTFQPMVVNAGIEYLTVGFPLTKYPGHLMVGERSTHGYAHALCEAEPACPAMWLC